VAKITVEQYAEIVNRIDVLGEKVSDIAVVFGCTPATIYNVLAKIRKSMTEEAVKVSPIVEVSMSRPPVVEVEASPTSEPAVTVMETPNVIVANETSESAPDEKSVATSEVVPESPVMSVKSKPVEAPEPERVTRNLAKGSITKSTAKPGMGLFIRGSDGEDNIIPFRNLEDALMSVKQILRTAVREPETVWFSLQEIDLTMMEGY
jgi:hypothetical protein